jgi:peptide/nickel transport system substrate-binding protein
MVIEMKGLTGNEIRREEMRKSFTWLLVISVMVFSLALASSTPAAEKAEDPKYGGTLTALSELSNRNPTGWDPGQCMWYFAEYGGFYMEHLQSGDPMKGPKGTNEYKFHEATNIPEEYLKGYLAESWEFPNPTTLIFHIRKGVMWQEKPGVMKARELTAHDVAFAFDRTFFHGPPKAVGDRYDPIKSVSAVDKYTFKIEWKTYYADWPYLVGYGYYSEIYPPEMIKAGPNNWRNSVGTGPFMLTNFISGTSLTFERNPKYWGKTKINGKEYQLPFVDKIVYPFITDDSVRVAAIRTARVDLISGLGWQFTSSLDKSTPELKKYPWVYAGAGSIGMRCDKKPFTDIRVRRALNMAIDRKAFIQSMFGGNGVMLSFPFYSGWPETLYTPIEKLPKSAKELFEYNPEKAKKLLAEAGYPNGFKTNCHIPSIPYEMDWMQLIANYWAKIGVDCKLEVKEYSAYQSFTLGGSHDQMAERVNTCGTPHGGLMKVAGENSAWNLARWKDKEFMDNYWKSSEEINKKKRDKMLKDMNIRMIDQSPMVLLPSFYRFTYTWPWVKNYHGENSFHCYGRAPIWTHIWIDQALKKKMGK